MVDRENILFIARTPSHFVCQPFTQPPPFLSTYCECVASVEETIVQDKVLYGKTEPCSEC